MPANVAVVANAPNRAGAEAFFEFLLSPAGQEVLLEPGILRLPILPAAYAKAPPGCPNPFTDASLGSRVRFDVDVSEWRGAVVDALFDQLITFPLDALKAATKAVQDAEAALTRRDNPQGHALLREARNLIAAMPVTEAEAASPELAGAFAGTQGKGARQAELEQRWAAFARVHYAQARARADEAGKLAR